jgi:hypothetical protein
MDVASLIEDNARLQLNIEQYLIKRTEIKEKLQVLCPVAHTPNNNSPLALKELFQVILYKAQEKDIAIATLTVSSNNVMKRSLSLLTPS